MPRWVEPMQLVVAIRLRGKCVLAKLLCCPPREGEAGIPRLGHGVPFPAGNKIIVALG